MIHQGTFGRRCLTAVVSTGSPSVNCVHVLGRVSADTAVSFSLPCVPLSLSLSLSPPLSTKGLALFPLHVSRGMQNGLMLASSKLHCRLGVRSFSPSSRPSDPGQVYLCTGAFWHTPSFSSWEVQFSAGLSASPPLPPPRPPSPPLLQFKTW